MKKFILIILFCIGCYTEEERKQNELYQEQKEYKEAIRQRKYCEDRGMVLQSVTTIQLRHHIFKKVNVYNIQCVRPYYRYPDENGYEEDPR